MSKNPSKNDIRSTAKAVFAGNFAGWLMRCLCGTLRMHVKNSSGEKDPYVTGEPVIYALWHNRIVAPPCVWLRYAKSRRRPTVVLTSASRDGATLEAAMKVCGLESVRGSSSRRGAAALVELKRAMQDGNNICITPDGPRGPIYQLQPGIIKLAQITGAKIIPISVKYRSYWELKTWDLFRIPKPFSKIEMTFQKPVSIDRKLNEEEFQKKIDHLQSVMLLGENE